MDTAWLNVRAGTTVHDVLGEVIWRDDADEILVPLSELLDVLFGEG